MSVSFSVALPLCKMSYTATVSVPQFAAFADIPALDVVRLAEGDKHHKLVVAEKNFCVRHSHNALEVSRSRTHLCRLHRPEHAVLDKIAKNNDIVNIP